MPAIPRAVVLALACLSACPTAARAQTTVVVPADRDNTLYEHPFGSFSNGAGDSIFCGLTALGVARRAVVRFPVASALPADAVVVAATLTGEVVISTAPGPGAVGVHRLLRNWGEGSSQATGGGGGQGAPSEPTDATWIHAQYPNTPWNAPGGDFASVPSAVVAMPAQGLFALPVAAADVQDWLAQPASNFGWLLKTDETTLAGRARRIHSREAPAGGPALRIAYLRPGQSGAWGVGCRAGGGAVASTWTSPPPGGGATVIAHANAPANSVGANFFAFGLDPVGIVLSPGCLAYLAGTGPLIAGGAFATSATGAAATTVAIPPGVPGVFVAAQAAILDVGGGLALGNAALLVTP
ncbi:MAG: DNRLRE domain-containing protein [Planctomycetota bacterium]